MNCSQRDAFGIITRIASGLLSKYPFFDYHLMDFAVQIQINGPWNCMGSLQNIKFSIECTISGPPVLTHNYRSTSKEFLSINGHEPIDTTHETWTRATLFSRNNYTIKENPISVYKYYFLILSETFSVDKNVFFTGFRSTLYVEYVKKRCNLLWTKKKTAVNCVSLLKSRIHYGSSFIFDL